MFNSLAKLTFTVFVAIILVGCGGSSDSNEAFSVSPSSLSFSAQVDQLAPADQYITLTAQQSQAEIPTLSANYDAIDFVSQNIVSDTDIQVTVRVVSPSVLGIGTHTAYVHISSSVYSVDVPVTYTVTEIPPGDPEVNYVSPYIIKPATAANVVIRGSGFSRFNNASLPTVTIGGLAAGNISVINDTEIRVTTPSLALGSHAVGVYGAGISFVSTANIEVIADQVFATVAFSDTGEKSRIIFDKERKAIYVVDTTSDSLDRYRYVNGIDWSLDALALTAITDAALSPDGKTLVLTDGSSFYEVDPSAANMSASPGVVAPLDFNSSIDRIVPGNNGVMVATSENQWSPIYTYDILTDAAGKHTYLNSSNIEITTTMFSPSLFYSPDASRVYFGEDGISTSTLYQLNMSDNTFTDSGVASKSYSGFYDMAFSNDGSVVLINGQEIYDGGLASLLGSLPQVHDSAAISPDGSIAYTYLAFYNILRAYDISDPTTPVQIGNDVNLTNASGMRTKITISNDGNTLFLVGTENLNIIDLTTFSF